MKWSSDRLKMPVWRWRKKAVHISLYALLLSVAVHAVLVLGFRVTQVVRGRWPSAASLVWLTQPRKPGEAAMPVRKAQATILRFAMGAPRLENTAAAALYALARMPAAYTPVFYLRRAGTRATSLQPANSPRQLWRWRIESEERAQPVATRSVDKPVKALDRPIPVPMKPAVFFVTAMAPGAFRSAVLAESSGDAAFDNAARDLLMGDVDEIDAAGSMHMRMQRQYRVRRVAVTIEPVP